MQFKKFVLKKKRLVQIKVIWDINIIITLMQALNLTTLFVF
jgi:hypothetical protein